jgi:tetratricopeptide (TPR) repeat protein
VLLLAVTVGLNGPTLALAAAPAPQLDDAAARQDGLRGLGLMMNGDLNGAIEVFKQIQQKDPQSPLGFVLEADATWWRIYYETANLVDPDVFAATDSDSTPYDAHFEDLVNIAIRKAEARIHANEDVARSYLYEGFAYALRARLAGLRDKDLPTARAGKKMRSLLLRAKGLDANLIDADLGLGIYDYFVDTLSAIVKILSFFIGLPGGSRTEGLRELQLCAEKGELARAEAKFYLAKDYSRWNEKQYERSMHLFEQLAHEYPDNPLWPMLIGSLYLRIGQAARGEEVYRQVYETTAGKQSEVNKSLHRAAAHALGRLHPNERFE